MSSIFEIKGHKKLITAMRDKAPKHIRQAARRGTRAGAKVVQAEARKLAPESTGELKKSIKVRSLPRSRVSIGSVARAQAPYSQPIEFGHKTKTGTEVPARPYAKDAVANVGSGAAEKAVKVMTEELQKAIK